MRRYTLDISGRNFVIDVQELAIDRFEVVVGDESYEVTLSNDENLSEAVITPGFQPGTPQRPTATNSVAKVRKEPAATVAASPVPRKPAGGSGGKGAVTAPMPGAILEISVKAGDQLERGQQVAILDAMKMHNVIGSPRAGTVAEVCVAVGQNVDHGDAIIRFQEG
jgi:biotin carboxyl carrier protein